MGRSYTITQRSTNLTINEIIDFYRRATLDELIQLANSVCEKNYGNKVFIRGLIEFSNYCNRNCLYCGIRSDNNTVNRYRLEKEEIVAIAEKGYNQGLRTFVLQSGEDNYYSLKDFCYIIEKIKALSNNEAAITLSCGIKSKKDYQELKKAGADRYLIRFETSDPELHKYLRAGISLEHRIKALEALKECGFETGSGYMVGLPGETEEIRINNALLAKKLDLNMLGIGPFIPHPATPLKNSKQEGLELTIKATALVRILLPDANIPATTAAGSLDNLGREKALKAGANVLMPNITPKEAKKHYLLYPGKICLDESGFECINCLQNRVATINKTITLERGDSLSIIKTKEKTDDRIA